TIFAPQPAATVSVERSEAPGVEPGWLRRSPLPTGWRLPHCGRPLRRSGTNSRRAWRLPDLHLPLRCSTTHYAHTKRRQQRGGDRRRRPQPDGKIVARHAPYAPDHLTPPFDSLPRVSATETSAIASNTIRSTYTGSGV